MSERILEYNFLEGLETSTDEPLAKGMEVLQNAYFTDKKTPRQRNGFESITMTDTDGNSIGTIVKIETFLESALIFTDKGIYVRAGGVIRKCGEQQAGSLSVQNVYNENRIVETNMRVASARTSSGLTCYVWDFIDSDSLYCTRTVFVNNNSVINATLNSSNANQSRVFPIVISDEIYIVQHVAGASTVSLKKFTESTGALSTVSASISITTAASTIDVVSDGTTFVVVSSISGTGLRYTKISTAGAIAATASEADANARISIQADLISGEIYTYYADVNKDVKMFVINYAALTDTSAIQVIWTNPDSNYDVETMVSGIQDSVVYVYIESGYATADRYRIASVQISSTYVPTTHFSFLAFNHTIQGKVATVNGRIYIPVCYGRNDDTEKGTTAFFLMNYDGQFIANALHGRVFTPRTGDGLRIAGYPIISGSSVSYPIVTTRKTFAEAVTETNGMEIVLVTTDILIANTSKGVLYQNNLIIPGPIAKCYDGLTCSDYQFQHAIYNNSATEDGAGNLEAGVRQWFMVLKYTDNNGNVHYSAPSNIVSLTVGASKKVDLAFESLLSGSLYRSSNGAFYSVEIYRTTAGGSTFYKLAELDFFNGLSQSTDANTYEDNISDTTLDDNDLYPNQEILDDDFASPCTTLFNYKNRLLMTPSDQPDRVKFSKEKVEGQASMFSEFLFVYNEETGFNEENRSQASCVLDDKIVVFKNSSIQITGGEPPNNAGEGGGLVLPQTIDNEVGCINPASVVQTANGVMFQSERGIYLLSRGLQVVPIGEPISDKTLTIRTSFKSKADDLVFFQTSNNGIAVYDTKANKWSLFTNYDANASTFVNGKIMHSPSGTTLFIQNTGYSDNGSFIVQKYTTPWIKLSSLQGFFRFKRLMFLGKWKSAHDLKFSFAYDYEEYNWNTDTFSPTNTSDYNRASAPTQAQLYAGANTGVYQVRMTPLRQKCEAVKITVESVDTGTDGESFQPTGLSFLVDVKRGQNKLINNKQG